MAVILVFYTIIMGFLVPVPALAILNETIRNLFFHVTMWFGMMIMMLVSLIYSIRFLSTAKEKDDLYAEESARTGMYFGIAGLITGMIWANYTWGAPWVNDPQLNGAAGTMLAYAAYFILRNAIEDEHKRARLSAVYCIFAFMMMIVFIQVLPKLTDTLHPGRQFVVLDRTASGVEQLQTGEDPERAQGHDEGWQFDLGDQEAVERSGQPPQLITRVRVRLCNDAARELS